MQRLEGLRDLGVIGDIRGRGLMIGIEFVRDPATMESFPAEVRFGVRVGKNCVHKQKMLIRYAPNWVELAPPFTVTEDEIDEMVGRLRTLDHRRAGRAEGLNFALRDGVPAPTASAGPARAGPCALRARG